MLFEKERGTLVRESGGNGYREPKMYIERARFMALATEGGLGDFGRAALCL